MERFKAKIYTIGCWIGCGLSTAFWATVSILGSLFSGSGRLQQFCMRRWSRDNLWLSRTRVEIEGLQHLDASRPQLLVANHSGLHDILALAAYLPIQFRWVAKKSLFRSVDSGGSQRDRLSGRDAQSQRRAWRFL
jgi:1-acyl-sn-glycerol-3-phosphate acyltransferase